MICYNLRGSYIEHDIYMYLFIPYNLDSWALEDAIDDLLNTNQCCGIDRAGGEKPQKQPTMTTEQPAAVFIISWQYLLWFHTNETQLERITNCAWWMTKVYRSTLFIFGSFYFCGVWGIWKCFVVFERGDFEYNEPRNNCDGISNDTEKCVRRKQHLNQKLVFQFWIRDHLKHNSTRRGRRSLSSRHWSSAVQTAGAL